jgi:DNA-binding GntR family transcriptional regulator
MVSGVPNRRDLAYRGIKERIVQGDLGPSMPLSEATLARILRTSRTPVREALWRLAQERYVQRGPGRGYMVAPVTLELIQNLFEMRRLLEGAAAARAAEDGGDSLVARLRELGAFAYDPRDAKSFVRAAEANTAFHLAVAAASRNSLLVDLVRQSLEQVTRLIALGMKHHGLQASASEEHRAVIEAVARRDSEGARRAMERHLDGSRRRTMDALLQGEIRAVTV